MCHIFLNEIRLQFTLYRRYWFESLASSFFLIALFFGVYFMVLSVSETDPSGGKLNTLIIGFVIWAFANSAYSSASRDVVEEVRNGTLEQLSMSTVPLWQIFLCRSIWNVVSGLIFLVISLNAIFLFTGSQVSVNYNVLILSLLCSMPSLIGLGFIVAGFAVYFKKAQSIQGVIYFFLIGLISVTAWPFNGFSLLPFASGATLAKSSIDGALSIDPLSLAYVSVNSIFYLIVGLQIFHFFLNKSRKAGGLGHY